MAQQIRPWTRNHEVHGSNLLVAAVVSLGKAFCLHYLVTLRGLSRLGSLVIYF